MNVQTENKIKRHLLNLRKRPIGGKSSLETMWWTSILYTHLLAYCKQATLLNQQTSTPIFVQMDQIFVSFF